MKFLDQARIQVSAGDGGHGGSIYCRADPGLNTLYSFRHKRHVKAERGENGRGKSQHGKSGADTVLRVPVGTIVTDAESGVVLADLTAADEVALIAAGGHGGRGNARFASSTHQAPQRADNGVPGQHFDLLLELRLLADAGLIGLPNAGKSSLLARVSAARPKIADYPFTTLEPILGVVRVGIDDSFVLADIPGLVEGAHEGRGLGLQFLRHVARTAVLVHLIDASTRTPEQAVEDFEKVNRELALYSADLQSRPQIVVASKIDLPDVREVLGRLTRIFMERGVELHAISAATGQGCSELMSVVYRRVVAERASYESSPDDHAEPL